MDQIVLEPEPKILDSWSRSQKFEFRLRSPGRNVTDVLLKSHTSKMHEIFLHKNVMIDWLGAIAVSLEC